MRLLAVFALLVATAWAPAASAATATAAVPQMTAHVVLNTTVTGTGQPIVLPTGDARVVGLLVEIPPGYAPGYHKHPYPRYAYVLAGHLDIQDIAGTVRHYGPGDMIIETVNGWHRPHVVGTTPVKLFVIDQTPAAIETNTIQHQ
jgi:quercetin dioxygenase-like cupin family protein